MPIPRLFDFNPFAVKWQGEAITDIRTVYDYSLGVHEVLLSGSVGSAKSCLLAHLVVTHCLFNSGACVLVARKSMPDLKDTIWNEILEHIEDSLVEGVDYTYNRSRTLLNFKNGSKVLTRSWSDGKVKKVRSLILSMAIVEELTEDEKGDFYKELKMRVGRIPNIKEQLIICATNPDSPQHWAYRYFIESKSKTRHVYYSVTEDNPFLPQSYIDGIRETLSPKEALRMLHGKWIELASEVIYYNYDHDTNYKDYDYEFNPNYPVDLMFDFNIALGKPMSAAVGQYINNTFHIAKTYIIHGARTLDIMEEMLRDGLFNHKGIFRVFGDAAGKHRDTRSIRSDYDIIVEFLRKAEVRYQLKVPESNPPIRTRHNLVNSTFKNDLGRVAFYVYAGAKNLSEGFRLTKLKNGSNYIEDDSFEYQHVTTAVGYYVCLVLKYANIKPVSTMRR